MTSSYSLGPYQRVNSLKDDSIHSNTKEMTSPTRPLRTDTGNTDDFEQETLSRNGSNLHYSHMTRLDKFKDAINEIWLWEILATVLSIACLGVVIWRLVTIDQKPYGPYQNSRPTPNTFISIFVTASKSFLLFAVAAGIGQLRWLYYQTTPKSLDELDMFEGASRGAGGSLLFLLFTEFDKGRARIVASWGALIMIVALAMDPFAQEILTFPTRLIELPHNETSAWMAVSESHASDLSLLQGTLGRQAIFGGVLNFDVPVSHGCVTGNCTWEPFTSLGVCSTCTDATNLVAPTCVQGSGTIFDDCTQLQYDFPDDVTLVLQNGSTQVTEDQPASTNSRQYTLLSSDVSSLAPPRGLRDPTQFSFALASFNVNLTGGADNSAQLATRSWTLTNCSLAWCAKVYENLSVVNNVLLNNVARDVPVQPVANSSCWSAPATICQEFVPIPSGNAPALRASSFFISLGNTASEIRNLMEFNYNVTIYDNSTSIVAGTQWDYSFASLLFVNTNITQVFQSVSVAYTNYLRSAGDSFNKTGTALAYENYVNVTYRWFILPAIVALVASAFLITVIVYTKCEFGGKNVIWKTTTLPLLLHGLRGWDREGYGNTESSAAMNAKARRMRAVLKRDEYGQIRFVKS